MVERVLWVNPETVQTLPTVSDIVSCRIVSYRIVSCRIVSSRLVLYTEAWYLISFSEDHAYLQCGRILLGRGGGILVSCFQRTAWCVVEPLFRGGPARCRLFCAVTASAFTSLRLHPYDGQTRSDNNK